MSKEKEDFLPELNESEKYHYEQMMIERAFENSYLVLTKKITFEKLMNRKEKYVVFNEFHVPLGYSCKHCFSIYLDNDVLIMIGNEDNIDVFGEA